MEMYRRTFAEINLESLRKNVTELRKGMGADDFFCPMVKANAYGHGDVHIAKALENMGVRQLGVCLIEEGLLLRNFGVKTEILVFRGFDKEGARKILEYKMTPVVSDWEHINHLEAVATEPVSIHLKFDTGMNRLGFAAKEGEKLFNRLWQNSKIRVKALVTHLAQAEEVNDPNGFSAGQLRKFFEISQTFKAFSPLLHALNSSGHIHRMQMSQDSDLKNHPLALARWGSRPGLAIYGVNPISPGFGCDLEPVMSLKSTVGVFRTLSPGESVSYGGTWTAKRDSVIAVVPIGYADGYHRLLSNRSSVLFRNKRAPIVGSICMDYLMIDVTDVVKESSNSMGNEVVLFGRSQDGNEIPALEVAQHSQTISWEVLTSVGERVPRVYKSLEVKP